MKRDKLAGHDVGQLFRVAREGFVARADSSFDFDAGLADVQARARAGSVGGGPVVEYVTEAAMGPIRTQVDRLTSVLALVERHDSTLAVDHLRRAREILFEFRASASGGEVHPDLQVGMLGRIGDHITMAGRQMRTSGGSLTAAVGEALRDLGDVAIDPVAEFEFLCDLVFTVLQGGSCDTGRHRAASRGRQRTEGALSNDE